MSEQEQEGVERNMVDDESDTRSVESPADGTAADSESSDGED